MTQAATQLNATLKTLRYQISFAKSLCLTDAKSFYLTDDEAKQLVSILMKTYGLESLVPDFVCEDDRSV
jgi:hypothetical protein